MQNPSNLKGEYGITGVVVKIKFGNHGYGDIVFHNANRWKIGRWYGVLNVYQDDYCLGQFRETQWIAVFRKSSEDKP